MYFAWSFGTSQVKRWWYHSILWRHNGCDGVSNHQPRHCLLNHLFRRRSNKTTKPRVIGLYAGNSPVTGEFPTQMASNTKNDSIWWRHHVINWRRSSYIAVCAYQLIYCCCTSSPDIRAQLIPEIMHTVSAAFPWLLVQMIFFQILSGIGQSYTSALDNHIYIYIYIMISSHESINN